MKGFSVVYRNYGHWDITTRGDGRIFRIRGGPGRYVIADERDGHLGGGWKPFKTVAACMSYICDLLMYELIAAKGQDVTEIEAWNVTD